ncbi:MAG: glycosyltransferase family 4 protein [Rhodospirillaceae bacterium]|jgi:alpha-maltose-1-phosphate synthase|nr:glycosyltransferase family 4 protein [Rhodospirillaceae bacterium]MBT5455766.1 glycosyltransferase family 4 protein [Rhodospirillaceae bacterium]
MSERLQVTLTTMSRFHYFEAALQLERRRALAAIYTGFARPFVRQYALPPRSIRTYPWFQTPLEALHRYGLVPPRWAERAGWHAKQALDRHVARTLPECHVYSALSSVGLQAGLVARARGAVYVCDRLSSHIVYQDRLLREAYEALELPYPGIDQRLMDQECAEYDAADAVLVPSNFARRSFVERGVPEEKIHCIPFGVNVGAFQRTAPRDESFRILFVGWLSVRKGLHHLLEAVGRAGLAKATLVLVGTKLPETEALLKRYPVANVEITGALSRAEVAVQMSRASVFVLPSIEEGFGMVMAEALACGCPVIASSHTGAADFFTDGEEGLLFPSGDTDALAQNLVGLHDDPRRLAEMSEKAAARVKGLGGWDTYGDAAYRLYSDLASAAGHDIAPAD